MISERANLSALIDQAFGYHGLGIICIKEIPNIKSLRSNLFESTIKLLRSSHHQLQSISRNDFNREKLGWELTDSYTNSTHDTYLKGFRAICFPIESIDKTNIFPSWIPDFKPSLVDISLILRETQLKLLYHIDKFLVEKTGKKLISEIVSKHFNGEMPLNDAQRINIYKPRQKVENSMVAGWHTDFGLSTGLIFPGYFKVDSFEEVQAVGSSLCVKDRDDSIHRIEYLSDEMVIQAADILYLLSDGHILSTPHAVKIEKEIPVDAYRITLVDFLHMNNDYCLNLPEGVNKEDLIGRNPFKDYMMTDWKEGIRYKEYFNTVLDKYYGTSRDNADSGKI